MSSTDTGSRTLPAVEDVFATLAAHGLGADPSPESGPAIEVLLADFLACATSARGRVPDAGFEADGVAGAVAVLALRGSVDDLDDVDWSSLHHPGSVIWPVCLALASSLDAPGNTIDRAAHSGYATAATFADLVGPTHRATWHVTATAGALGAASAASILLNLSADDHARALALTAANVGGLAIAARQRMGAASFNRMAAALLGLGAARAAAVGASAVENVLDVDGGLLDAMAVRTQDREWVIREGVGDAAFRVYPVSGFLQSTVAAVADLRSSTPGALVAITVEVPTPVFPLINDSHHGPWWDASLSALRSWASGDPFAVNRAGSMDGHRDLVIVQPAELRAGHARVSVRTDQAEATVTTGPPAVTDGRGSDLLEKKWRVIQRLAGWSPLEAARAIVTADASSQVLGEVWVA